VHLSESSLCNVVSVSGSKIGNCLKFLACEGIRDDDFLLLVVLYIYLCCAIILGAE
jgi:hypothetical protein